MSSIICVAACSFEHGVAPGSGSGGRSDAGNDQPADSSANDAKFDGGATPCPTAYNLTFGTHHYRTSIVDTRGIVKADCANDGQHVVKIDSAAENEFVRATLAPAGAGGSYFWIGLTWSGSAWQWDDGSALGTYENFAGGPPNGTSNPCVDVSYNSGVWSAYQCDSPAHDSLCECDEM